MRIRHIRGSIQTAHFGIGTVAIRFVNRPIDAIVLIILNDKCPSQILEGNFMCIVSMRMVMIVFDVTTNRVSTMYSLLVVAIDANLPLSI